MRIFDNKTQMGWDGKDFLNVQTNFLDRVIRKCIPDILLNLTGYGRKLVSTESVALTQGYIQKKNALSANETKLLLKLSLLQDVQLGPVALLPLDKRKEIQEIYRTEIHNTYHDEKLIDDLLSIVKNEDPNKSIHLYNRVVYYEQFDKYHLMQKDMDQIISACKVVGIDFRKLKISLSDLLLFKVHEYTGDDLIKRLLSIKFAAKKTEQIQKSYPYTALSLEMVRYFHRVLDRIPAKNLQTLNTLLTLFPGKEDDVMALIDLNWENITSNSIETLPSIKNPHDRFNAFLRSVLSDNSLIEGVDTERMMGAIYATSSYTRSKSTEGNLDRDEINKVYFTFLNEPKDTGRVIALIKAFPGEENVILSLITAELLDPSPSKVWNNEKVMSELRQITDPARRLDHIRKMAHH